MRRLLCSILICWLPCPALRAEEYDLVVYGGTSAGVTASIQAARMKKRVVLVEPSAHVGGLTTAGLGFTDSGDKSVIGGLARLFYQRVKKHYDDPASWRLQPRDGYPGYRPAEDAMWTFEPHVAERILEAMLREHGVEVVRRERLDRERGVQLRDGRIRSIAMESGKRFAGKMFIDATYEGDLMAAAKVRYHVGREPNAQYRETLNGVARTLNAHNHRFLVRVDPFVKPGDATSGLLHGIDPAPYPEDGAGDHRLQAFCYRMCMSNSPENRIPFPKPADYDEARYELLLRNFEAGDLRFPMKPDVMPNRKTDTNNNGAVSTDYIGQNHGYAEGGYAERERILARHESYQKGLMWTLANHPRVPEKVRQQMQPWGLPKDEFPDAAGWPHQIYVREARRMVGAYVHTEADCRRAVDTPKSVGMGSYNMDSHNCMRYVTPEGAVQNEGDVQVSPGGPYRISYLSLVPRKAECENLLVPVCLSSSHIAYGSIRMEPVFMILGESAGTAACLAIDANVAVQDLDYPTLRAALLKQGQVLEKAAPPSKGIDPKKLAGVVIDDEQAERTGFAAVSVAAPGYVGGGYRHDGGTERGKQSARYQPDLPVAGRYEVRISYTPSSNRATNAPVAITHADGESTVRVNQQKKPPVDGSFVSLGVYRFAAGKAGSVRIHNADADGHVIIDAVQWLRVEEK